jgi:hypothetical protein
MHTDPDSTDWNFGEEDHEGEMATGQLHRISDMASTLQEIIGSEDELPGWVQYKLTQAYSALNDVYGYMEPASEHAGETVAEAKAKKKGSCSGCKGKNPGLWCNICKKRARGEKPAKPGQKGYPKTLKIEVRQLRQLIGDVIKQK